MSDIYEMYQNFRQNRIKRLGEAIQNITNSVREAANELPEKELLKIFKSNPKESLVFSWKILKLGENARIYFKFGEDTIGESHKFQYDCIKKCNELLNEFEYGLIFGDSGLFYILPRSMRLTFSPNTVVSSDSLQRFKEDTKDAFSSCKYYNGHLIHYRKVDGNFDKERFDDGYISIVI